MTNTILNLGQEESKPNIPTKANYGKPIELLELFYKCFKFNKKYHKIEEELKKSTYFKDLSYGQFIATCIRNIELLPNFIGIEPIKESSFNLVHPNSFIYPSREVKSTLYDSYILRLHNNMLTARELFNINRLGGLDSKVTKTVLMVAIEDSSKEVELLKLYKIANPKISIFSSRTGKLEGSYEDIKKKLVLFPFDLNKSTPVSYGIAIIILKDNTHIIEQRGSAPNTNFIKVKFGVTLAFTNTSLEIETPYLQHYGEEDKLLPYPHQNNATYTIKDIMKSPTAMARDSCFGANYKDLLSGGLSINKKIIVWASSTSQVKYRDGWGAYIREHFPKFERFLLEAHYNYCSDLPGMAIEKVVKELSTYSNKDLKTVYMLPLFADPLLMGDRLILGTESMQAIREIFPKRKFSRNTRRKKRQLVQLQNIIKNNKRRNDNEYK